MNSVLESTLYMSDERYSQYNFARWLRAKLLDGGVTVKAFSDETGLVYTYLSRLVNSSDKPIAPETKNLGIMADALVRMGLIQDRDEAFLAAGYEVSGYVTIKPENIPSQILLEGWDIPPFFREHPEELQKLLAQFEGLSPEEVRERVNLTAGMLELIKANTNSN